MRKRCMKTMLSVLLAVAMLVTAAPADMTLTVQASETGVEDPQPAEPAAVGAENVGGGVNSEVTNPDGGITTMSETGDPEALDGPESGIFQTPDEGDENPESPEAPTDPTATTGAVVEGKKVTFTCVASKFVWKKWGDDGKYTKVEPSNLDTIIAQGSSETFLWGDLATLTKTNDTDVWKGTAGTLSPGSYSYKFTAGGNTWAAEDESKDTAEFKFVVDGLLPTTLSATKGVALTLPKTLKGYKDGSEAQISVSYSMENTPTWLALTAYSDENTEQTLTVGDSWDGSETVTLTAAAVDDASNTADVTVTIDSGKTFVKDPNIKGPKVEGNEVTFYFFAPKPATQLVKVKGSWTDSWTPEPMDYNEDTGYWSKKMTLPNGVYKYGFETYKPGENTTQQGHWSKDPENDPGSGDSAVTVGVLEAGSPIIDGKTVKFIYENAEAYRVYVAGEMSGWGDAVNSTEYKMKKTRDDDGKWTGFWELEKEMSAGVYAYKYIWLAKDSTEPNWVNDPLNPLSNEDGNNKFIVSGLADSDIEVERTGKVAELPDKLKLYAADGADTETAVTYTLTDESLTAADKAKITLSTADGKQTIKVTADFPKTIKSFKLTAAAASGETSTFTVNVVDQKYKYEIYYFDEEEEHEIGETNPHEKASLWIYSDGVNGTEYKFNKVQSEGDNNWLKAEVELSLDKLCIIPRSPGEWKWQDTTREYKRPADRDKDAVTKLYIIFGDDANIYEEIPATVRLPKRYLVIEYERTTSDIQSGDYGWKIYTWNSGYGSNVYADFEPDKTNTKKGTAKVKIKKGLESLSFCMAYAKDSVNKNHDEHAWKDKDGGDYRVEVPIDQQVVKVKMEEGKGVTYTYPYNTGYELEPAENKIHFYYRDDEVFQDKDTDDRTVTLEVGTKKADGTLDKTEKSMAFNAAADKTANNDMDTQRFSADVALSLPAEQDKITYYYRYKVPGEDGNDTYVLDNFNTARETIGGVEYSVCTYEKPDLEISAEMQNASMDYNENNVLTVSFKEKGVNAAAAADTKEGAKEAAAPKVAKAVVDLSAVGGSAETQIDPELLEISIAVTEGTATGVKNLPIVVYDEYGNKYETSASVNVTARNKGDDFDWDEAVIYFAVTDRFFDGNAGNNGIGYNVGEYGSSSYHGGDFAGLTQKLDYLDDLGVNTIWITPIVEQQTTANSDDKVGESWGYHGYWAKNFEKLDSHLGTEAEFKALLDAAHARGMKVMVDVVLNHAGYGEDVKEYFNSRLKDEEGNSIPMIRESKDMINGNDQKSSLSGLQDFLTENKEVRDLLVEWQSNWISKYDIDYYRVDTVKHVDNTTWNAFKNALTRINPDFKMIGEWAGAGYATDTGTLGEGRMDSLLDFDFNNRATDFVTGKIDDTEKFMVARNSAINNTAELGAFLGSHDEDGFVYALVNDKKVDAAEAQNLALVAASLQLTAKGQVVIYYGEEIGMTGANNYPWQTNRYDFDWDKVNSDNAALAHYKAMLAIRNRYSEVLAKGTRTTITADDEKGLDVFSRSDDDTKLIVALNIGEEGQECTFATGLTEGTVLYDYYASYKNGEGRTYTVGAGGSVTITVPAAADGGTVVLTAGNPGFTTGNGQEGFDIKPIASKAYTGKNITLTDKELVVYYDGRALELKKDYTVSYKNNKTPGTATVTIKGKGNYAGSVTTEFEITRKDVDDPDIVVDYKDLVYTGKAQNPISKITNTTSGVKLGKKDYTVKYYLLYANGSRAGSALSSVKADGRYQMEITGTGNYTGKKTAEFRIVKGGTYMNKTKITLKYKKADVPKAGIPYSGEAITLQVEVKNGNEVLKQLVEYDDDDDDEDDDDGVPACYKVVYLNNVEVGTATVKIIGIPTAGYCGEVVKTFKIAGVALSSVAEVDSAKWQDTVDITYNSVTGNGEARQPKENEGLLKKKANAAADATLTTDDYEVTYAKNDKPGSATVTFTGKRKYTGKITKTFTVNAINISALTTTADADGSLYTVETEAPYRKKGATAAVTVTYKGSVLQKDRHYKLTYSGNKAVTTGATANVKITGMGIFKGDINAKFAVAKQDLSAAPAGLLTVPDVVFVNRANKYVSTPVLDGTKLKAADYTIEYYNADQKLTDTDIVSSGTVVTVKVTPKSTAASKCYTGTGTAAYRVTAASIAKAKISVKAKEYTGRAITLGKSDFSSVKVGKDKLVLGRDFEIVAGSYTNNTNKGTASVTIKGIGNYSGEKKVTFKITSRFMRWWWNLFS